MFCLQLQKIQMNSPLNRLMIIMTTTYLFMKRCCHQKFILSKLIQKHTKFTTLSSQSTPIRILNLVIAISPSLTKLSMTMRSTIMLNKQILLTQSMNIMKMIQKTSLIITTTKKLLKSSRQPANLALSHPNLAITQSPSLIFLRMTLNFQLQNNLHKDSSSKSALNLTNKTKTTMHLLLHLSQLLNTK